MRTYVAEEHGFLPSDNIPLSYHRWYYFKKENAMIYFEIQMDGGIWIVDKLWVYDIGEPNQKGALDFIGGSKNFVKALKMAQDACLEFENEHGLDFL